jgi:ribose-phosphate pyrophosphokinase
MADTAGTLCKAADVMKEAGAKSVRAIVTHGVLSGNACEKIENSSIEEFVCTDSIPIDPQCCSKLHMESLAAPIAHTIRAIQMHTSVSEANSHQ